MGLKRMMNGALGRGWSAWHEMWSEKVRQRNLLKQAGSRLLKPKLVHSFSHWRKDWEVDMMMSLTMTQEQKLAKAISDVAVLEKENHARHWLALDTEK